MQSTWHVGEDGQFYSRKQLRRWVGNVRISCFEGKNLNQMFRNHPCEKLFASAFSMSSKKIEYNNFLLSVVTEVDGTTE